MTTTDLSKVRRMPERGCYDPETVHQVLDAGFLAHVGFVVNGQPFVIPTLYGRDGSKIFVHGSAASRMLRELEQGVPVCLTVTHVDGMVLARSAFNHSMNYRSVVVFGTARKIQDPDDKVSALRTISEHLLPGRWDDVRGPSEKELKATTVLEVVIEEASVKTRSGPPKDDAEDYALNYWAGVLPISQVEGRPLPDPLLPQGTPLPGYLRDRSTSNGQ